MVVMEVKGDALRVTPLPNFRIAFDRIGSIVPVGVNVGDVGALLTQLVNGTLQAFEGMSMGDKQGAAVGVVRCLQALYMVVNEAHPPIQSGQTVQDVAVKTKKADHRMPCIAGCSQSEIVFQPEVSAVPEKGNGRHEWGLKMRQPGVSPGRQQIKRDHKHLTDQELLVRSQERNTNRHSKFIFRRNCLTCPKDR